MVVRVAEAEVADLAVEPVLAGMQQQDVSLEAVGAQKPLVADGALEPVLLRLSSYSNIIDYKTFKYRSAAYSVFT